MALRDHASGNAHVGPDERVIETPVLPLAIASSVAGEGQHPPAPIDGDGASSFLGGQDRGRIAALAPSG